jgi:hypothetical protein
MKFLYKRPINDYKKVRSCLPSQLLTFSNG